MEGRGKERREGKEYRRERVRECEERERERERERFRTETFHASQKQYMRTVEWTDKVYWRDRFASKNAI